jgi:thiamine-monophosphate kinase
MIHSKAASDNKSCQRVEGADSLPLSEFEIIRHYFADIGRDFENQHDEVVLSGGDDCALLSLPENHRLALSIDTLVADRHFPADANAYDIARRTLAVSVSDLAAMGAKPVAFTLALTLPEFDQPWIKQFSQGLSDAAQYYEMALIGGDTTRGPLSLTVQVHGIVPAGKELRRSGANVGDKIFVSGSLGDAALALDIIQQRLSLPDGSDYFCSRYYCPSARVELGQALQGVASAAIDISDGLLADLNHILVASNVGAKLQVDQIPKSSAMLSLLNQGVISTDACEQHMLSGGDDYELCFTVAADQCASLIKSAKVLGVDVTEIGIVEACKDEDVERVNCFDREGKRVTYSKHGFQHF